MSIYCDLLCEDCKVGFWLGKAVFADQKSVKYFHRVNKTNLRNWEQVVLNQALWKFLADHKGHNLRVLADYEIEQLIEEDCLQDYTNIEGSVGNSFTEYLEGWDDLRTDPDSQGPSRL